MNSWHPGQIVFVEGDTVSGKVKYDMTTDMVQLERPSGKLEAYSARKILIFAIEDKLANRNRKFISLPYSPTGGFEKLTLFEILVEGRITLLSREKIEVVYRNSSFYNTTSPFGNEAIAYDHYLLKKGGKIELFDGKKNTLLSKTTPYSSDVKTYMKDKRLKPKRRTDLAQIIAYYNSIK